MEYTEHYAKLLQNFQQADTASEQSFKKIFFRPLPLTTMQIN